MIELQMKGWPEEKYMLPVWLQMSKWFGRWDEADQDDFAEQIDFNKWINVIWRNYNNNY